MDNKEDILDALEEFGRKSSNDNVPPILEEYLLSVARTGETLFPWCKMKCLFMRKLEAVVADFEKATPMDASEQLPNVENVCFTEMTERLKNAISKFNGIPFTIQRLCELVTSPHKHYKKTDKFLRGIEKNVMVVSTVDPHGNKIVSDQKPLMNGTDGANGFAGDMKTPEKITMSLVSPTPMNSPVASNPLWYASLSGAGDSVPSHNTWQQQEHPVAESVSRTAGVSCVSADNDTAQTSVDARTDGSDMPPKDDHSSDTSTACGMPSTETTADSVTPCVVPALSSRDVPPGDVETATAIVPGAGGGSVIPAKDVVSQSSNDTPIVKQTDNNSTTDQSLTGADENMTDSETSLDVSKCTSPDSSDAADMTSSDSHGDSETSNRDGEASECTSARRQRRDSGGFETPVIEGRVESETNSNIDETVGENNQPSRDAVDAVAPPDSSNVVDNDASPVPVGDMVVQESTAQNVASDSVTCSNSKEAEHSESSASSQSSEGLEVVDASPSQSSDGSEVIDTSPTQSESSDITDSGCTQTTNTSAIAVSDSDVSSVAVSDGDVSSVAVSDTTSVPASFAGDVSSSHHEPMDTN